MTEALKYCVIGAGNGGLAMAGYIASQGLEVNLYNRSRDKIEPLIENPTIYLQGEIDSQGKLALVTDNIKDAIENVDIIMITIPAIGHQFIAKEMAPYIKENQIIVLNPGRTGGALEVYETLLRERKKNNIIVAEAQTFIYATRAITSNRVHIYKTKKEVSLAAIPATKTNHVTKLLNQIYPQFINAKDVLETSINNYGAIFHPAPTILNTSQIDRGICFEYYIEGITLSVANFLEQLDKERLIIGDKLGLNAISAVKWLEESYGATGDNLYEAVQNNSAYRKIESPESINTRYLLEDIPFSLVPMESIAKCLGIETPSITSIINIGQIMLNKDFRKEGRTADRLGLEGLTIEEMHLLAREGRVSEKRLKGVI